MRRFAKVGCLGLRADRGASDIRSQRQTFERSKLLAVLRSARRVAIDARRQSRGVYRIGPDSFMAMCHAIDEAYDHVAAAMVDEDRMPGDAEADAAIAAMNETYGRALA